LELQNSKNEEFGFHTTGPRLDVYRPSSKRVIDNIAPRLQSRLNSERSFDNRGVYLTPTPKSSPASCRLTSDTLCQTGVSVLRAHRPSAPVPSSSFAPPPRSIDSKSNARPKSVHTKDLSGEGSAMNTKKPAGQICRWFGEMRKSLEGKGGTVNLLHKLSIPIIVSSKPKARL